MSQSATGRTEIHVKYVFNVDIPQAHIPKDWNLNVETAESLHSKRLEVCTEGDLFFMCSVLDFYGQNEIYFLCRRLKVYCRKDFEGKKRLRVQKLTIV